jgi:hypothetical protein
MLNELLAVQVKSRKTLPERRAAAQCGPDVCLSRCPGRRAGDEVVQPYIHAVTFRLDREDVGFYDEFGRFVVEPGEIDVLVGDSSEAPEVGSFEVRR